MLYISNETGESHNLRGFLTSQKSFVRNDGTHEQLKYDFVVRPGGNVKDIKLKYGGASSLSINADGSLTASTLYGKITEQAPYTYEKESGEKVASAFVLRDNVLSFDVGEHIGTLVIDPALAWATYFGGSGTDYGDGVASDLFGNVIVAGYTASSSNIVTTGGYLTNYTSSNNTFLAKFNSQGNIQWATYYYGAPYFNDDEYGEQILACDPTGNIYITGIVTSTVSGLATPGCYQSSNAGGRDAYLAKFDATGNVLWATYYGGSSDELVTNVACDASGNVFFSGWTYSTSGIATSGAYQSSPIVGSGQNQFLAKFNSIGTMQWSTYFGGNHGSNPFGGLICDGSGNVFISGNTYSTTNIATPGAFQTTLSATSLYDAYLAKFNSNGLVQWSTYYGGNDRQYTGGLACDNNGNVFLCGTTASTNNIATTNAYQTSFNGSYDAFLVKFDAVGNRIWGTYFGGTSSEFGMNVVCNSLGHVFLSGATISSSNIVTASPYQSSLGGSTDGFLAEFDGSGNIQYGTYYGGSLDDYIEALACDPSDNIFMVGTTYGSTNLATTGSYQNSFGGGQEDAFLGKWGSNTFFNIGPVSTFFCAGDTLRLSFYSNDTFQLGNVFKVQLSDSSGSFINAAIIGMDTATSSGSIFCTIPANSIAGIHYRFRILSTLPADTTHADALNIVIKAKPVFTIATINPVCNGQMLPFNTTSNFPSAVYHWSGPNSFSSSLANPIINPVSFSDSGYYYVSDTLLGCIFKDTIHIAVFESPSSPMASANYPCLGDTLKLFSSSADTNINYSWRGPASFNVFAQDTFISNAAATNAGAYHAIFTLADGCADTINVAVSVSILLDSPTITIVGNPGDSICLGGTITFSATTTNTVNPIYQWRKNGVNIPGANGATFTSSAVANGDVFTCRVHSALSCQPIDTAISNAITLHVILIPPPNVTLTSYTIGDTITFSGHVPNGSTGLTYQWEKNGAKILGATQSTYTILNGVAGDIICLIVHSSVPCTMPDSTITCTTIPEGVETSPSLSKGEVMVWPNPVTNTLHIEADEDVHVSISSIEGKVLLRDCFVRRNDGSGIKINDYSAGTYILEIIATDGNRSYRKFIKE